MEKLDDLVRFTDSVSVCYDIVLEISEIALLDVDAGMVSVSGTSKLHDIDEVKSKEEKTDTSTDTEAEEHGSSSRDGN